MKGILILSLLGVSLAHYRQYTGIWVNDITDKFTCNEAQYRNKTYVEWCIFDLFKDARDYCDNDPLCRGFVVDESKHQIAHMPVVPSTTNGTFYERDSFVENGVKRNYICTFLLAAIVVLI